MDTLDKKVERVFNSLERRWSIKLQHALGNLIFYNKLDCDRRYRKLYDHLIYREITKKDLDRFTREIDTYRKADEQYQSLKQKVFH